MKKDVEEIDVEKEEIMIGIISGTIVLLVAVILFVDKIKHRDEIRYNYKAKHYGVVKKKKRKKMTSVLMSTNPKDEGKDNIPMERNANPNDTRPSYFIKRVRTYERKTYGKQEKSFSLTKEDRKTADQLYKKHEQSVKEMEEKKKAKKDKKKKPTPPNDR